MLALCGLSVDVVSLVHANQGVTKKTCVSACAVINSAAEKKIKETMDYRGCISEVGGGRWAE